MARAEDFWCVTHYGSPPHPDQSCLCIGGAHLIFSRQLSTEEWSAFSSRVDEAWSSEHSDWDGEGVVAIMQETTGAQLVTIENY